MKHKEQEDFVKEQISKSGYPLEVEVHSILEPDWSLTHYAYFLDDEEDKSRLLDIHAFQSSLKFNSEKQQLDFDTKPFLIAFNLAIECKRSEKYAWVFYTLPNNNPTAIDGQYFDELGLAVPDSRTTLDSYIHQRKSEIHYTTFDRVASLFQEVKLKKERRQRRGLNEIYEGINELVKFVSYSIGSLVDRFDERDEFKTNTWKSIFRVNYFFPVLV